MKPVVDKKNKISQVCKSELANFSADLRRVAYWIYGGEIELAKVMLKKTRDLHESIDSKVLCYGDIWDEIGKIEKLNGGKDKATERALTVSVILMQISN